MSGGDIFIFLRPEAAAYIFIEVEGIKRDAYFVTG